jgi:hypothetical protein
MDSMVFESMKQTRHNDQLMANVPRGITAAAETQFVRQSSTRNAVCSDEHQI